MLHGLVQRDLGIELPFRRFMETIRERPDRFTVLSCHFAVHEQRGWDGQEQTAYAAALARAGMSPSTIALAERTADPMLVPQESEQMQPDLLAELHAALADLLHAASDEPFLRDAVGGAMAELLAVPNGLDQGERRSSTLHHCSSSSSAATTNPAAAAADRMPAASSTRMPDRIAQP